MFLILICLWWWYAIFLGTVYPANGFLMYLYEFTTLAAFAMAFRYWSEKYLFPIAVLLGSFLMLIRFILIYYSDTLAETSKEGQALFIAVITLLIYVVAMSGALAVIAMGGVAASKKLNILHQVTNTLLLVGVLATVLAVDKAEGIKWGSPPSG